MNRYFILMVGLAAGMVLGIFFFGGLWLTLRKLPDAKNPVVLTLGSFFVRVAVSVSGFYLAVRAGGLEGLLACLAGFMLVKFALVNRLRSGGG